MPERLALPADLGFWPACARAVLDRCNAWGLAPAALHSITWLVPQGAHAVLARAALHDALGRRAFRPPRVSPFGAWLETPLHDALSARIEIHAALRANAWVRDAFGARPAALWSLARSIAVLCDELDRAAIDAPAALEERLDATLRRHYHRRAQRAVGEQARLVLAIWAARRRATDSAAAAIQVLAGRADQATGPLVFLGVEAPAQAAASWEQAFAERWAARAPVLWIEPQLSGDAGWAPVVWPELAGADRVSPDETPGREVPAARTAAERRTCALRLQGEGMALPALRVFTADTLDDEAAAVAVQTIRWLRAGVHDIALVVLDRLTARRARALLERAQVRVRDETGWTLSTTTAAGAVMRWFDLAGREPLWRDLLDWLKSPFALAGWPRRDAAILCIERALRQANAIQGMGAFRAALSGWAAGQRARRGHDIDGDTGEEFDADLAAAESMLEAIEARRRTMRLRGTLIDHVTRLAAVLDALGMRAPLVSDPVGRTVLDEIDAIARAAEGNESVYTLAEFRALLAGQFEQVAHVERSIDSPVRLVSLTAAALRPFGAALLVGADAEHLPAAGDEALFLSQAVRAELGLRTAQAVRDGQARCLASLLSTVPEVAATWRVRRGDEPVALSPLLERLRAVLPTALGFETTHRDRHLVSAEPVRPPAPSAGALLPGRLSAAAVQALVTCPYQFHARRLLALAPLDEIREDAEKRDLGQAIHAVLESFHAEWGEVDLSSVPPDTLAASLAAQSARVFGSLQELWPEALTFQRVFDTLAAELLDLTIGHARAGWRWQAGERWGERLLELDDGRRIVLVGRIDRIDRQVRGGQVRVVDYKVRGPKQVSSGLREPGEDVQLPLYGLLLGGAAEVAEYLVIDTSSRSQTGRAARRVLSVAPPQDFRSLVDAVDVRLRADLVRIAAGAPLPAHGVESDCRHCDMRGVCRRGTWAEDAT